ncbi:MULTISPECIES: glutamine synthetase family protein [unclassified Duganella]|uniref:glutamine synthetase family protein n=1 Tax=unclassified Duganella TaxID=2636909 RepID=UPI000887375C|nr:MULTISPECIES: glutamine synthetase family protein [unclassified Duganella]SDG20608.1 glutamine synthetase [Duganella sp. OV458]SDJ27637.1 glutamine synthetase [Duganella sp. OV510]
MSIRENFSDADMDQWLNDKRVTEIECLVPDLTGVARGKILPRAKFTQDRGMRIPEAVLGMTVTGNYPTEDPAYDRAISNTDRDMILRADPGSITTVPWAIDPTAQVIHDCYFADGTLVDFAPRSVLRRVLKLYADKGWKPIVGPELEFYLTEKNIDPDLPLKAPVGRSGRAETTRQVYSIDAVNEFDPLFEDIYDYCALMNLDVDTLIHETGAGQMGLNFQHGDALALADNVFYFKRTLREAALKHDMYATFMAKPMAGEPGSAMHVHQSVSDAVSGRNIFSLADGSPSPQFRHYIGGLQRYTPAAMAILAPYVNSYRRIVRHTAAPINVQWGMDNRTVGFRIPISGVEQRRVENRIIGADANPYLGIAVTLACGYLGLVDQLEPTPIYNGSAYDHFYELPQGLPQALALLRQEDRLRDVLGERFIDVYTAIKELEHQEFMTVISPWEREHLLLHV